MDGEYQERYENIWPGRPNDVTEDKECVIKDGDNSRYLLVYKTQEEKEKIGIQNKTDSRIIKCLFVKGSERKRVLCTRVVQGVAGCT